MLLGGGAMVAIGANSQTREVDSGKRWLEEGEFNALYARTSRPLAAYVRRMTGGEQSCEDLVQDAYLRILRSPIPFMDERELDAYLYKTASRLIRDRWRRSQVDRRWRERLPLPKAATQEEPGESLDVDRVLAQLRERDRAIVWLACVEGRSHAEVAAILGLKSTSVRVLLFRARKKLARLLEDCGLAPEVNR